MEFFAHLFDTADFPARWTCGQWSAGHGWLHILSDLGVWSAYLAIPVVLVAFVERRGDLPFRGIFLLFGAFILLCGTTHLMEALIFWWPAYRLAGVIKLLTAVVSWATVAALIPIVPKVLTMRSPEQFERDLAERTAALDRANAALTAEREQIRVTLASIGDAVIATDTAGRVTFLNAVAEALTGWPAADALGQPLEAVFVIVNETTRAPVENPAHKALKDGVIVGLANHTVLVAKDGAEWPIDDSAAPIRGAGGHILGAVLVFRDVTDRRQKDADLRRLAADLSAADRRKDEFLATLAHELRNPLAPIRNGLQILRAPNLPAPSAEQTRAMMERQLTQMVRLVDDLMDVSRISRDKVELRRERVELAAVVRAAVETVGPLMEAAGHTLTVTLPPGPVAVNADPTRLAQVFANLLNNAAKYTDPGGAVTLTAARDGDSVTVAVADTGVGIPAAMLGSVFEMFTQADRTLEKAQGGLGIGLTLVKRLTEMHGGAVEARSDGPGRGSEFVVRLPVWADAGAPTPAAPAAAAAGTGPALKILVADDNADAATSLATLLRLAGHGVLTVHDGAAAVEAAATFRPDVVLLDIGMPKLNGYEACRRVRELPGGGDITVVACTGWGQDDDRRRAHEAGFDAHLVKPINPADLDRLLAERRAKAP